MKMRKILGILRDSYCRTTGIEYMHISEPSQRRWIQDRVERPHESLPREEHLRILDKLNESEIFETFLQTTSSSVKSASPWRAGSRRSPCSTKSANKPPKQAWKRSASACRTAVV